MESIKQVIMKRDGIDSEEADALIKDAKMDLNDRLSGKSNDDPFNICADWFGLEEDYVMELVG